MAQGTCIIDDCTRDVLARGMCSMHYGRWNKHGDALHLGKMGRPPGPVVACSLGGCESPVAAHGWCDTHYRRWKKSGDPLSTKRILGDIEARFWSKVDRRGDDECWPWLDAPGHGHGYGLFGVGQDVAKAHVWAYEHFVGPVPQDKPHLDHACHTRDTACPGNLCAHRLCVNFLQHDGDVTRMHLEPVTSRESCLRGRRTKMSDEAVIGLHARHLAGEKVDALALEAGTHRANLYKRFRRLEAA